MTEVQRVIEFEVPAYYTAPPPMAFREGTAVQIEGQTHRADLNGKFAVCVGRDGMRTLVMTAAGDTLSVVDAQLRISEVGEGTRVTLVGLRGEDQKHFNGQIGIVESFSEPDTCFVVKLEGEEGTTATSLSVSPLNLVISPEGSEEVPTALTHLGLGKKRRLLSNLVSGETFSGAPTLLSVQPIAGAASRLMAIDAAVAMSSQQPILKRCGTLRKLVHGFPGFAQLVICVVTKLHADPTHPGRVMEAGDVSEGMKIASALTDGRMDGVPRRDLREAVAAGSVTLESVLRIADRYCGANHLVFAIDSNFAGIRDTVTAMVHQITLRGITNVVLAASSEGVKTEGLEPPVEAAAADLLMQDVLADTPIIPFNNALASRYAKKADVNDQK